MKKYLSFLLILAIAGAFSLSVVVATDFEEMDFDGKFKMDIIKGCDFDKTEESGVVTYVDIDNAVMVLYMEDPMMTKDVDDSVFDEFKSTSGFEDDGTDGDIRVYKNNNGMYGALAIDDGIMIFVGCEDRNDAIEMAKSIEFTD